MAIKWRVGREADVFSLQVSGNRTCRHPILNLILYPIYPRIALQFQINTSPWLPWWLWGNVSLSPSICAYVKPVLKPTLCYIWPLINVSKSQNIFSETFSSWGQNRFVHWICRTRPHIFDKRHGEWGISEYAHMQMLLY